MASKDLITLTFTLMGPAHHVQKVGLRPGFLSLGTTDILGQVIPCAGGLSGAL